MIITPKILHFASFYAQIWNLGQLKNQKNILQKCLGKDVMFILKQEFTNDF